jgi:hypothetical protein
MQNFSADQQAHFYDAECERQTHNHSEKLMDTSMMITHYFFQIGKPLNYAIQMQTF